MEADCSLTPWERRRSRLGVWRDAVKFRVAPPDWDSVLSSELTFGDEATAAFLDQITQAESYLEFGAGSSTIAAVQLGVATTSVESDWRFLEAVGRTCLPLHPTLLFADIGPTAPWGVPRRKRLTPARTARWRTYPLAPWQQLGPHFEADLVLVDGRFRVACALAVVLNQPVTSWTLLVDDYVGRKEYAPIAQFAELVAVHGRMAQFRPRSRVSALEVEAAFTRFTSDWR